MKIEKFKVNEVKGKPGLLVTDHVYKPGRLFSKEEWKWGDDALEAALKNKRCSRIESDEEIVEEDVQEDKIETEEDKRNRLEKLLDEYGKLKNPNTKRAKGLYKKIEELQKEIEEVPE